MAPHRLIRIIALAAASVLAFSACSSDNGSGSTDGLTDDQKAVQAVVRASLDAENAADAAAFLALWTDTGLESYDVGSRDELLAGENPDFGSEDFEIVAFGDTTVTADAATVVVDAARQGASFAKPIFRVTFDAVRTEGAWLLDGFEFLGGPPPAAGTEVVDIEGKEYAFAVATTEFSGDVAFRFTNAGTEQHEISFYKGPDGIDLLSAKAALENVDGSELTDLPEGYQAEHIAFTEPGGSQDIVFADPLASGTYIFTCYIPEGGFGEQGPVNPEGKAHIQLGMISVITVT